MNLCIFGAVAIGIAGGGSVAALAVFLLGRGRLQTPDLDRWTNGEPAWDSPPLFALLRRKPEGTTAFPGEPAQSPTSRDDRAA